MYIEFGIRQWAACGLGLWEQDAWRRWASSAIGSPVPVSDADSARQPSLDAMPAMMRRRLETLGRLACHSAYGCAGEVGSSPLVFASRYGDAARSLALLGDLCQGAPLSPTGFGLSVHNAIAALFSMARQDKRNATAVAAGRASVAAALIEAAGLLADGTHEVLVVYYDAPLPGEYGCFHDEPAFEYAWAWRLARPEAGKPWWSMTVRPDEPLMEAAPEDEPAGLALLRFILNDSTSLLRRDRPGTAWEWRRHG